MTTQQISPSTSAASSATGSVVQSAEMRKAHSPIVELPREEVERIVEEVRKVVAPVAQDLRFSLDQQTGKTVIRVVDSATNEVIRQIPSEEVLAIARALDKIEGLLLNHRA